MMLNTELNGLINCLVCLEAPKEIWKIVTKDFL